MKFIESLKEGMHVSEVYLCKTKTIAMSKTGKEYASLSLHDKTGSIDAKIWDLYSPGISDVDAMTFVGEMSLRPHQSFPGDINPI